MPVVPIRSQFEDRRLGFIVRPVNRFLSNGPDLVQIFTIRLLPIDTKSFATLGEAVLDNGRAFEARTHRVLVVLNNVNDREFEEGGHIQALVEATLIDGTITQEAKRCTLQLFVFDAVSQTKSERSLPTYNTVATPIVLVGCKEVHRTAFAFRAAGGLSI